MKIIVFFLFFKIVIAEEIKIKYDEQIRNRIISIKDIKPENYPEKISEYRDQFDNYIKIIKENCERKYSSLIIKESKITVLDKKRKLTWKEKQLCLTHLKSLNIDLVNASFIAKKNYLKYLHDQELKALNKAHQNIVNSLKTNSYKSRVKRR